MARRTHRQPRISAVNIAGLTVFVALLSYSVVLVAPSVFAGNEASSMAAASVSIDAGVAANPDNTAAQQLKEKAAQLDVQQQHIQQLQQSLNESLRARDSLGLYSLISSALLLLLVSANFYFDWRRSRGKGGVLTKSLSIDLRPSHKNGGA